MERTPKPWTKWSMTKLSLLQKCPKSFEFEYVLGMKDKVKQGAPKLFGSSIHHMVETYFSLKNGYKSLERFVNAFRYHWLIQTVKIKYKDRVKVRDPNDIQNYLAIGINLLKKFYYKNLPYRTGELPKPLVEERFNFIFKGHRVNGKIDRIQLLENNGYEIWDYKTGYKKPTAEELLRDIQFTLYNLAWLKKTGQNPEKMRMIHLFSGEHFFVPIRTKLDYIQLGCWLDEALVYVQHILEPWRSGWKELPFRWFNPEDIERKHFSKRPSSFCGFCDYEELCRQANPKDELRSYWVEQELKRTGPYPEHIQLGLNFPKTKRKSPR